MNRRILTYGGYFEAFINTLKEKEQEKIQYGLLLLKTQDRLPKKFIQLIRVVYMSCVPNMEATYFECWLRLPPSHLGKVQASLTLLSVWCRFFIFDEGKVVVLFNGFQKKTQKTPPNEIEKALKIKEAYYADKQSSNR